MPELIDRKMLKGREAVDAYRSAHLLLYSKPWHSGIPVEHTPLLEKMLVDLGKQGYKSMQEFFTASELLNIKELGFLSKEGFDASATDKNLEDLSRMWR